MNYNKLHSLINKADITVNKLSALIGMSNSGLRDSLRKETLSIDKLEKLAAYFKVPCSYFFNESEATPNMVNEPSAAYGKVEDLKCQLKDKAEIIELQRENIAMLKEKIGQLEALKTASIKQTSH